MQLNLLMYRRSNNNNNNNNNNNIKKKKTNINSTKLFFLKYRFIVHSNDLIKIFQFNTK